MTDLKLVVVTHAHPDHSGGAMLFHSRYNIPIAAPTNINKWYAGPKGFVTYVVDLALTYLVAKRKARGFQWIFFPLKVKAQFYLEDQSTLPGFEDWQVISTPGHTFSDISLYHNESRILYLADNLVASKSSFYRPYPIVSPASYRSSLQKYIDLAPQKFLLAHYGEHEISKEVMHNLMQNISNRPRNHINTLPRILKHIFK